MKLGFLSPCGCGQLAASLHRQGEGCAGFHFGGYFIRPRHGFLMGICRLVPQEPPDPPAICRCRNTISAADICIKNGGSSLAVELFKCRAKGETVLPGCLLSRYLLGIRGSRVAGSGICMRQSTPHKRARRCHLLYCPHWNCLDFPYQCRERLKGSPSPLCLPAASEVTENSISIAVVCFRSQLGINGM